MLLKRQEQKLESLSCPYCKEKFSSPRRSGPAKSATHAFTTSVGIRPGSAAFSAATALSQSSNRPIVVATLVLVSALLPLHYLLSRCSLSYRRQGLNTTQELAGLFLAVTWPSGGCCFFRATTFQTVPSFLIAFSTFQT